MFKCIGYSIFINRSCNVIGMFLHFVHSISHCYSDGGMAQHTYIVSSVAKCHCFFQANTEVIDDFVDTLLFGISFGGDIGKGRKPTPGFAVRQLGKNLFFLLQCNERCHLEDSGPGG